MYSYSMGPWFCKRSSVKGQFTQIPKEHIYTHPWWYPAMHTILVLCAMCVSATTPIRKKMNGCLSSKDKNPFTSCAGMNLHVSKHQHIKLKISFMCWSSKATNHKTRKCSFVLLGFFCHWPFKIFLTGATTLTRAFFTLIRYSRDAARLLYL